MRKPASSRVPRPGLRSLLRRQSYRRLFAAQTVSRWGDTFNTVGLAVLVYELTGSGLGVSGVVAAEIVPVLLFAPVAGLVVDRTRVIRVMVAADLWRATVAALLPLVAGSIGGVYAIAFALSGRQRVLQPCGASVPSSRRGR